MFGQRSRAATLVGWYLRGVPGVTVILSAAKDLGHCGPLLSPTATSLTAIDGTLLPRAMRCHRARCTVLTKYSDVDRDTP